MARRDGIAGNLLEKRHQLQFRKAASSGVVEIVRVVEDNDARVPPPPPLNVACPGGGRGVGEGGDGNGGLCSPSE